MFSAGGGGKVTIPPSHQVVMCWYVQCWRGREGDNPTKSPSGNVLVCSVLEGGDSPTKSPSGNVLVCSVLEGGGEGDNPTE
jgi:hypothetical protein